MVLTEEERDLIESGLYMRKHFIETGDPLLSAQDAKNMGNEKIIKALSTNQHMLLVKIDNLINKIRDQK